MSQLDLPGMKEAVELLKAAGAKEVYIMSPAGRGTLYPGADYEFAISGLPPEVFFTTIAKLFGVLPSPPYVWDLDSESPTTEYLKGEGRMVRVG